MFFYKSMYKIMVSLDVLQLQSTVGSRCLLFLIHFWTLIGIIIIRIRVYDIGNPTRGVFELAMAAAEHAKYSVAFASGSSATSSVIHLLSHGDKVLCIDDVYGGTQR